MIFPPQHQGGVSPGLNVCDGYLPENLVIGQGPFYVANDCTTVLTDCQLNSITSEILAAVDRLGFGYNSTRITNLGDALVAVRDALQADINRRILRAGDTMEGPLNLWGPPANDNEAANKKYVDDELAHEVQLLLARITAEAAIAHTCCMSRVAKAGDVMTGPLHLWNDPVADGEAANKRYVDGVVIISPDPPPNPRVNQLWWDSSPAGGDLYIWYDDGDSHQWVITNQGGDGGGGATIIVQPTKPTDAEPNTLWWDSSVGKLYLFYKDLDSEQWVEIGGGVSVSDGTFTDAPADGQVWARQDNNWIPIDIGLMDVDGGTF